MSESNEKEIFIKYERKPDCQTVAATGAWGGANPQGEIVCNFFVEHVSMPEDSKIIIDLNTGEVVREEISESSVTIREIQVRVVMRPDIAKVVGQWLVDKSGEVTEPSQISVQ